MHVYDYIIESKQYKFNKFKKENICFLDIETTGLSRKSNHIYLIGLIYFDINNSSWNLKQFFADKIEEEKELLEKLNNFINKFKTIITYNGESFDLPFIKHRLNKFHIKPKFDNISSFDIYRKVRRNSSYLNLKNYKLKTIEESLGIYRSDEHSGKDCIGFYYQYVKTGDKELLSKILKHNYDDLYYLMDILRIFDTIKDIKTTYVKVNNIKIKVEIADIIIKGDLLSIICETSKDTVNIAYYGEFFSIRWEEKSLTIDLEFREALITPTKKCLFVNISDWPSDNKLEDSSQYLTPKDIILLKVEDKFEMDNIKNIIVELISYV